MQSDSTFDNLVTNYNLGSRFTLEEEIFFNISYFRTEYDLYFLRRCIMPYANRLFELGMVKDEIVECIANIGKLTRESYPETTVSEILKYTVKCIESGEKINFNKL